MDALVYPPGEGEVYKVGNSTVNIKAAGEHTTGTFFLSESVIEPGFPGSPPHFHRKLHDMFFTTCSWCWKERWPCAWERKPYRQARGRSSASLRAWFTRSPTPVNSPSAS